MKRFVTTALVAITVGVALANIAGAQRPIKDIGNPKRSPSPFEDVAKKLGDGAAPKRSLSPFEDVAKKLGDAAAPAPSTTQRPAKLIGKPRKYIQCAANSLNLDAN